ncbi:MAG: hypothetical protein HYU66_20905 [Armatimonadetes bacterium]|nr:hypothetical protein [Armatimonadota bacterium]
MEWIPFPDPRLPVIGLPWFAENSPELWRLPRSLKDRYRPEVWGLALSPAGGRIRFATSATAVGLRLDYGDVGHMNNMHRIGQHSVDCYVDGVYWATAAPLEGKPQVEVQLFSGVPAAKREVTLNLPLYHPVKVQAVGFDETASLAPPAPFAVARPVAFYGSSITQGGCASRAGMSYQAILCRRLNLDHVNLGFSGNGRGEPELAEAMAAIDASCYVLDYAQNCTSVEQMRESYTPFLTTLRAKHPETPIVCITPIGAAMEGWSDGGRERLEAMREVVHEAVAARVAAGDQRIQAVEGHSLLGPAQMDGIVDSSHPNDLGFWFMANGLERVLAGALGL